MIKLNELIETKVQEHLRLLNFYKKTKSEFEPVLEKLQEKLELQQVYVNEASLDINIVGDKHILTAAFRVLYAAGFKTNNKATAGEPTYYGFFYKEGVEGSIWLSFSSTSCRRVKIGTKEVDIFETVCDEQIIPQPLGAAGIGTVGQNLEDKIAIVEIAEKEINRDLNN